MKNQNDQWSQVWQAAKNHPLYRGCFLVLLLELTTLLLGISFWMITHALLFALLRLGVYWAPTYRLLRKGWMPGQLPGQIDHVPVSVWNAPIIVLWSILAGGMVAYGLIFLFRDGFLAQNLIWMLIR